MWDDHTPELRHGHSLSSFLKSIQYGNNFGILAFHMSAVLPLDRSFLCIWGPIHIAVVSWLLLDSPCDHKISHCHRAHESIYSHKDGENTPYSCELDSEFLYNWVGF